MKNPHKKLKDSCLEVPPLRLIGRLADKKNRRAFAVGGFVRDLMLGVENFDVDVVVEGDGIGLARELAVRLKASLVIHKRFGTATVIKKGRFKIDIATARTEYYNYPAALPEVKFSSIKQDLYRRDFTINAMAVSLNKSSFGHLIDFFGGVDDLKKRKVRVLHEFSFVDDPTRVFRAIRFEQRYNFTIEPRTERLIRKAVRLDMFGRTQKQRLRNEIILILSEARPIRAIARMHKLHELKFIHPRVKLNKRMLRLLEDIEKACSCYESSFPGNPTIDRWLVFFFALIDDIDTSAAKGLCESFVFTKADTGRILSCKKYSAKVIDYLRPRKNVMPSEIYKALRPLSREVALFIMAKSRGRLAKERIGAFFKSYNGVKVSISGEDLKRLGVRPGPGYKKLLDMVLYAKIDGYIKDRAGELNLVRDIIGAA